ncbi:hypothetical protein EMPS_01430 [Entomortierella parvispora]|uniref:Nitrogen regulatory protein areA GATA-like domain-containing protein n=1 Tax=Entomortierella parvispora TaxID=205924 RepID=A0A9P3LSN8_9FUNG|nr:hypothetical protein EMPS_01430 [Entomortierella parvispora]
MTERSRPSRSASSTSSSSRHRSSSVSSDRSSRKANRSSSSSTSTARHGTSAPSSRSPLHRKSSSAKTTPMHDDTDAGRLIPVDRPALAIDYLGNGWCNEDDIAASWKFMTKQKNDLINGLRLENASWRNWAKQRHHLKTVSPKSLNWLKDSDTTWLYGPLYKASIDEFDLARFGTQTISNRSTTIPTTPTGEYSGLKPALKHKTASELFKEDTLFHVQSDLKLDRKIEPYSKAQETAVIKQHRQPKLRFNDSVEQCVSINSDVASDDELQDDEDEDDGIMMRISDRRRPARSIVRINPTRLKAANIYGVESDDESEPSIAPGRLFAGSETTFVRSKEDDSAQNDAGGISFSNGGTNSGSERTAQPPAEGTDDDDKTLPKGGIGRRAADMVNNVKDIVNWASSLVYNSSTF